MQKSLRCSKLVLALALILVLESSVQGYPMPTVRRQWVRCSPNSNSANCIDEKGPMIDLLPGESNRILLPRTDSFSMTRFQNLKNIFPLSEDYSGSGSDADSGSGSGSGSGPRSDFLTEIEQEYQPVDENDAFYYDVRSLEKNLPSDSQDLGQDGSEDNFII
ncbi:serglycin [Cynocephalus volans]|uniref:serglycin n=1 Tax=Cynocephalus volans TaxID=110931 RepID=UPI002FC9E532